MAFFLIAVFAAIIIVLSLFIRRITVYTGIAAVGAIITGLLGWILAINAMWSSNEIAAGIILAASALAFGLLLIALIPRDKGS